MYAVGFRYSNGQVNKLSRMTGNRDNVIHAQDFDTLEKKFLRELARKYCKDPCLLDDDIE